MQRKPLTNGKYKCVTKLVDTGKTIKDVQFLSDQFVTKKRSELFKRIKGSTIVKLIDENNNSESIYKLVDENENIYSNIPNENSTVKSVVESQTSFKTNRTDMTTKTTVTAITYATEMLGNLV
jgi:hypothetical protein